MADTKWTGSYKQAKVLFPADPTDLTTVIEAIWVLPLVGDENEGTGVVLNTSVSGEDHFRVGDLATWISPSPQTQKAEIVASFRPPWKSASEASEEEYLAFATQFHNRHRDLRRTKAKTIEVVRCERCGKPGIGRLLPDEQWRKVIPPPFQKKNLCNACIDEFAASPASSPKRSRLWRR